MAVQSWSRPGLELTDEEKAKNEYKLGKLTRRMVEALKDAVPIFERAAPEWIDR